MINKSARHSALRTLPAVLVAVMAVIMAIAGSGKTPRTSWDADAARRKADYMFVSAYSNVAVDSAGPALYILDAAGRVNPSDEAIRANRAMMEVMLFNLDSARYADNYEAIRSAWTNAPDDYIQGSMLAEMANRQGRYGDAVTVWQTLDSLYPAKGQPRFNLAKAYTQQYVHTKDTADYNKAMAIYNRMEQGSGKDVYTSAQKISLMLLRNDSAAVYREVRSILDALPNDATAHLYAGAVYDNMHDDSLALKNYRESVAIDSTSGQAYWQLASFYHTRGDSIGYDREVFNALRSANLDFDVKNKIMLGYLSELYSDSLQWPRIEELFGVMKRLNGDEPELYALMGRFCASKDDYKGARENFDYASALDPSSDEYLTYLVQADGMCDSTDAVIEDGTKGIERFPDNMYFPIVVSNAYSQKKDYDKAIAVLRAVELPVIHNKKAVSQLYGALGDTYYLASMPDSAFVQYEKAIELDPENYMIYNNAAYFMAEKGIDLDKALRYGSYAVASEPENPTFLDTYAWIYFKRREYDKAADEMIKALEYSRTDSVVVDEVVVDTLPETPFPGLVDVRSDSAKSAAAPKTAEESRGELLMELAGVDYGENAKVEYFSHAGDIAFMAGYPEAAVLFWKRALAIEPDNELLSRKVRHKTYFYK